MNDLFPPPLRSTLSGIESLAPRCPVPVYLACPYFVEFFNDEHEKLLRYVYPYCRKESNGFFKEFSFSWLRLKNIQEHNSSASQA